ncbi:hypothetical protein [Robertkochia aurantiaca]|uniref:hypothetical protein n=1 Tax=Robertkochia aurantiaca TaxID=2873700 RepID=UPI001CCFB617|nr:hypothetical protein [Robertkochia sp. 3YJGBD-33]
MVSQTHVLNQELEPDEVIEDKIHKKIGLQLRNEDFLHLFLILFAAFVLTKIIPAFKNGNQDLAWPLLSGLLMILNSIYSLIKRWVRNFRTEYFITNKRLIIYDNRRDQIIKSFPFKSFPRMVLRENAYNSGFIILGEYDKLWEKDPKDKFEWRNLIFRKNYIDTEDYQFTLDNLPEVRKVYNNLLAKIEEKANST